MVLERNENQPSVSLFNPRLTAWADDALACISGSSGRAKLLVNRIQIGVRRLRPVAVGVLERTGVPIKLCAGGGEVVAIQPQRTPGVRAARGPLARL